jgi:hypothetical protein
MKQTAQFVTLTAENHIGDGRPLPDMDRVTFVLEGGETEETLGNAVGCLLAGFTTGWDGLELLAVYGHAITATEIKWDGLIPVEEDAEMAEMYNPEIEALRELKEAANNYHNLFWERKRKQSERDRKNSA